MIIRDRLYGTFTVDEPVLPALLQSQPVERLKGICQYGVPDEYYHKKNYSRYEHSVGVMLLLRKLKATLEEQIAGLLHDISHTAFSHTIDWVIGEGKTENFQDEQYEPFLQQTQIPQILKEYGFEIKRLTNPHLFGLLEREAPDLCADRMDYSLREMPETLAITLGSKLRVREGRIVFHDKQSAALFARQYLQLQTDHWGGYEAASRYRLFANALRKAIDLKVISFNDFWQDDAFIIHKIKHSDEVMHLLQPLTQKSLAALPKSSTVVYKKFRFVDPWFIENTTLIRLTDADEAYKAMLLQAKEKNAKGVIVPKINLA